MAGIMQWADLAVAGGGSTAWELAHMGVPGVYFVLAKNQKNIVKGLAKTKMGISAGDFTKSIDANVLRAQIFQLMRDEKRREKISQKCQHAVDGHGARRIVEILQKEHAS